MKWIHISLKQILLTLLLVVVVGLTLVAMGSDVFVRGFPGRAQVKSISVPKEAGSAIMGGLIMGTDEALYGVFSGGGAFRQGLVFKFPKDGKACQILYNFGQATNAGAGPCAKLVLGKDGTLYGTTYGMGDGSIFRLSQDGSGFRTLYRFGPGLRFCNGPTSLSVAPSGRLFGTACAGGAAGRGTIFSLNADGSDFRVLHSFGRAPQEAGLPRASVVVGSDGSLYGTTLVGGRAGHGTIFKIQVDGSCLTILHHFAMTADDGEYPDTELAMDGQGVLYGITSSGGADNSGELFEIKEDGSGYRVLHDFGPENGMLPFGRLLFATDKNLYGLTAGGGEYEHGNIFRMRPVTGRFEVVYDFQHETDCLPLGGSFLAERFGMLYGTTPTGGGTDRGYFFSFALESPNSLPSSAKL
jgi:uncharacterized repeat protein (TIGR03803 family)